MKVVVSIILLGITICSYAEEFKPKSFPSVEECRAYADRLIDKSKNEATKHLFTSLGFPPDMGKEMEVIMDLADNIKGDGKKFRYFEDIGMYSLGTFVSRIGYIVKYEDGTIFYEITVGKISEDKYAIVYINILSDTNANELLLKIPEYYWKLQAEPAAGGDATR